MLGRSQVFDIMNRHTSHTWSLSYIHSLSQNDPMDYRYQSDDGCLCWLEYCHFMVSVVAASHRLRLLPALLLECVEPGDGNELDLLMDDFDGTEEGEQDKDDEDDDPTPFSVKERLNKRRT